MLLTAVISVTVILLAVFIIMFRHKSKPDKPECNTPAADSKSVLSAPTKIYPPKPGEKRLMISTLRFGTIKKKSGIYNIKEGTDLICVGRTVSGKADDELRYDIATEDISVSREAFFVFADNEHNVRVSANYKYPVYICKSKDCAESDRILINKHPEGVVLERTDIILLPTSAAPIMLNIDF